MWVYSGLTCLRIGSFLLCVVLAHSRFILSLFSPFSFVLFFEFNMTITVFFSVFVVYKLILSPCLCNLLYSVSFVWLPYHKEIVLTPY